MRRAERGGSASFAGGGAAEAQQLPSQYLLEERFFRHYNRLDYEEV
jgi:hypothetical protein